MSQVAFGYLCIVACAVLVILGDTLIKFTADQSRPIVSTTGVSGLALYLASGLFWFWAVQHITLGQAGVAFAMFTMLALCVLGALVFGETIGLRELMGIVCAIAALLLMVRFA